MIPDSAELARRIKREILSDVAEGTVPATVSSFSDLHKYVDANCYGGTEAILDELDSTGPSTDEWSSANLQALCDLCNPAFEIVDVWIKAGGIEAALTRERLRAKAGPMKVTVYRPRELIGLGEPVAFLGDEHPTKGDWVQSAKADFNREDYHPLHLLGRAFLIYSMYHVREPRFVGYAIENFGAACEKLGYTLPLKEEDAVWLTYPPSEVDPAPLDEQRFMLKQIAKVFGTKAACEQAAALGINWTAT